MFLKSLKSSKVILVCLTILLLSLVPSSMAASANGWSKPVPISGTDGTSGSPHLAVDSRGTLHMVWKDWVDLVAHLPYILYANKPAGGNWTPYVFIQGAQMGESPAIAVGPNDTIHIVWTSADFDGPIKYVSRTVNGSWSEIQVVSLNLQGNSNPDIAVAPNGTVHVAWNYGNVPDPDNRGIYHAMKPSGGSWSTPVPVYQDRYATNCLLETDIQNAVNILITSYETNYEVRYAYKQVGENWSAPAEFSATFTPIIESVEQLVSDDEGKLHLVWGENDYETKCRLYYSNKPLGEGWTPPTTAVEGDCQDVYIYYPSVTINHQGNPIAAWSSRFNLIWSAWFAYTGDMMFWSSPTLIDDDIPVDNASSIVVDGNGGHHFVRNSGPAPAYPGEIFYYYRVEPPEPPVTVIITPAGGTLQSASGDVQVVFPPGAVTEDVAVTYSEASTTPTGQLAGILFFDLSAKTVSGDIPVTTFLESYTLTVNYGIEGSGPTLEDTLVLYYWNGTHWQPEPSSVLDTNNKTVTATLDHMTLFALLGETLHIYLPFVMR